MCFRHLLNRLMPHDPTYHILLVFSGASVSPNRLSRSFAALINRQWYRLLHLSFPTSYARWAHARTLVAETPSQRRGLSRQRRQQKELINQAAGWFVSGHRLTMLGFCFSVSISLNCVLLLLLLCCCSAATLLLFCCSYSCCCYSCCFSPVGAAAAPLLLLCCCCF